MPGDGSILTSYTDDDKLFWKEFRRELVKEGFPSSVIKKNRRVIMKYVMELGSRGLLDEIRLDEDYLQADATLSAELAGATISTKDKTVNVEEWEENFDAEQEQMHPELEESGAARIEDTHLFETDEQMESNGGVSSSTVSLSTESSSEAEGASSARVHGPLCQIAILLHIQVLLRMMLFPLKKVLSAHRFTKMSTTRRYQT